MSWGGVSRAAQPFLVALFQRQYPDRTIVAVTPGVKAQELFQQDVETWLRADADQAARPRRGSKPPTDAAKASGETPRVLFYPAWETLPHEPKLPHADVISERLETLVTLAHEGTASDSPRSIVIANVVALMQKTFSAADIERRTRLLRQGDRIDPLDLIEWLEDQGYEPEAQVTQKGELALRGGILDLYPLTSPWPVRLEFFGDELESLRYFDPFTQVSRESIASVTLSPGGELGILRRAIDGAGSESAEADRHSEGGVALGTLLDVLPSNAIVVLCGSEELDEHAAQYSKQAEPDDPFLFDWSEFQQAAVERGLAVVELDEPDPELEIPSEPELFSGLDAFRPVSDRMADVQIAETQRKEFFSQLHRWLRQNYAVHVFCNNDGERQRFTEIWNEYGFDGDSSQDGPGQTAASNRELSIHLGSLSRGFLCEPARAVVVTDAEIFGRYKVQRPRRLKSPHAAATRSALDIDFTDLEEGDYVVHLQHGIGRYCGLKVLPAGLGRKPGQNSSADSGTGQECLVIEYAAPDPDQPSPKLYVPVTEAHLVGKYVGAGKARPPLNTLGGTRWAKAKAQAEDAVRDLAAQMLSLQASRESQAGHAFPADTPWQREFESAFLYEETPDQMRAINETKRDLEAARPMDRLICGDVGYGKTEVAIRAAFKAVMGGKQAAILVPTTILAQQHYNTFRERMADYPVRVEQLSRFCSRRDQKRIVVGLGDGSVDIVIGTHRLLQSDIVFKDLGLVVVDEEQRFGVMHKEKLKLLRTMVDVLTLSATPIPRTLYLALTGARDMSTIETPPQDRLPVETIVTQYDERTVRDAIRRELNRQGQVYYLHNRVHDIQNVALRIQALVPEARIAIGHGQMESDELENVMAKFINGEADVLVSTTIIESGIDIPNANTIIIDRADRFGLSDLYQLRGRVGRYKHQAYAYLLLPRHASLLSDARKRISAIRQYSSLGSGFKIAMRDLEIRGAGNLLGSQQSGHITAVGFELYCQLLKQSVSALKGEKVRPRIDVAVRLDFLAFHPGDDAVGDPSEPAEAPDGKKRRKPEPEINVPREVTYYFEHDDSDAESARSESNGPIRKTPAYIPFSYIRESRQRIEIYRKIAQTTDKAGVESLRTELRDRFGRIPPAVDLLLQVTELKCLAADRGLTSIESKRDKIMLMRHKEYITVEGKFPRFTKTDARGRIQEIKKLVLRL